MALSSSGIGSNLDVNGIISQLMSVEQRPLTLLNQKEAGYQAKLTAYGSLKGVLGSFQSAMQNLSTAARFQGLTSTVGDPAVFSATAATTAAPGSYAIAVTNLAQSQVLAGNGIASATTTSAGGTLTLQVGSGTATTITIDTTNNTLSGLRDAINAANAGATATIVNDGSANPQKLVLTANATGAANTIAVTNNLAAGELHDVLDSLGELREAKDAVLSVNAVPVTSASNTLTEAIAGVTLNLAKSGSTTLTIARDTAAVQTAVASFVKAYNDVNTSIKSMTGYNATTKQGGILIGDSAVQQLQVSIRATLSNAISGTGSSFTMLSQIGVTFQKDGALALDSAKLTAASAANFSGIGALFGVQGKSSDALLSFISAGDVSSAGDYRVDITSAAAQAAATAANIPAPSTLIDGSNDGYSVKIDGIDSGSLTLAHGTYTPAQLVTALQAAIDASPAFKSNGVAATVALSGGKIAITSQSYGLKSSVAESAGTALSALGFDGSESGVGVDVAGNFVLNGNVIAATGAGQILTGVAGTVADGLKVRYAGTAAQAASNASATLNFSDGYATRLSRFATAALKSDGALAGRTGGIDSSILDIADRRAALNRRLVGIEARYRAQFSALDSMISRLNQTSSFLTQQLANLPTTN